MGVMQLLRMIPAAYCHHMSIVPLARFIVANLPRLCHKPPFVARLIKGCRVDVHAGCFISEIAKHFQRSNEHFSRETPLWARLSFGHRRAKCPS
jgi:hypothetical protein